MQSGPDHEHPAGGDPRRGGAATAAFGWRDMKTTLEQRPLYHRLEDRIRAHISSAGWPYS
jgi:hypothetical protein